MKVRVALPGVVTFSESVGVTVSFTVTVPLVHASSGVWLVVTRRSRDGRAGALSVQAPELLVVVRGSCL